MTWFAAAAWSGSVLGESLWWASRTDIALASVIMVLTVSATAVCYGVVRHRSSRALFLLFMCGLSLGATLSLLEGLRVEAASETLRDTGARAWTGQVVADAREGAYGARVTVRLTDAPCEGARASVCWPTGLEEPEIGEVVTFRAVLEAAIDDPEYGRKNVRAGVLASGSPWSADVTGWRSGPGGALSKWRAKANAELARDEGSGVALLRGIALGDKRALFGSAVEEDFRILGLSHVLAVSGMHLGLVCALVLGAGKAMRLHRRAVLIASVLAGAAFVVITGAPTSAVRALLMVGVGALAEGCGVRREGLSSLAAAVLALVIVAPWGVFSLGLQLSVAAVGGLLLFGRLAAVWAASCEVPWLRRPVELMALTCLAQSVTAPLTAPAFGMFSILAPVANAVVLPCLPVALSLGLVGLVLQTTVGSWSGRPFVVAAQGLLEVLAWVVARLASLPGAAVMIGGNQTIVAVGAMAIAVIVWVVWPLPRQKGSGRRAAVAVTVVLAVVAVGVPQDRGARIIVCDVGQADAVLLQDGGRTVLIDAGADGGSLREALAREGIRRLDAVILTHAHDDHTGGLAGLSGVATVGWVGVPVSIEEDARSDLETIVSRLTPRGEVEVRSMGEGDTFTLGGCTIDVLWPDVAAPVPDNTNDTSIVLALHRGAFDAVFTGDAEGVVQEALAAQGSLDDVEVLKVPHHGSNNGLTTQGLEAWRPEVAVISVGEGNRFGHPHAAALQMLQGCGARVYRTDQVGDITIEIGTYGFRVRTQRLVRE